MGEKRFVLYEHKENYYILENPRLDLDFIEMLGDALTDEEIVDLLNDLSEENERLKERLDFFKDLAQRTEHEKEDYADKYYNLLKKKFSDDEIRRLYSDLQRREYEKHCNGGTTFTAKLKQEVRY